MPVMITFMKWQLASEKEPTVIRRRDFFLSLVYFDMRGREDMYRRERLKKLLAECGQM